MSGYVLVVGLGINQNQVKPASDFTGKTCAQLKEMLGFAPDTILAIRSPFFIRALKDKEIPLKLHKELRIKERPTKYSFPDYCLVQLDASKQNTFTVFVKPVVKNCEELPPFPATIEVTKDITSAKMIQIIDQSFKMDHHSSKILNFTDKTKVTEVMKIVKEHRIQMECELTESARKKIATRRSIIQEIASTEETYINGLQMILDVWQPRLTKSGKFTELELGMIFKQFPGIIRCHRMFLDQLKARGCDFKADISDIFLDFADFFKVSAPYISNYAAVVSMLATKRKASELSLFTLEDGRELSSFLITPIQRMPRYILFLRELMKVTPVSHPDYLALEGASAKIQKVTLEMDEATKQAGNANEILELQQALTKPQNLLVPGRVILHVVQVDRLKSGGKIYLFNDAVVVVVGARKGWKLRWMGPVEDFRYFCAMCDLSFYGKKKKLYSVSFDNLVEEQQFLEHLEATRMKHFPDAGSMFVWSIPFLGKFLPDLKDCRAALVNQVCYFVGAGKVVTFGLYGGSVKVDDTPFHELTGFTMEAYGDKLYVFGGIDHNGEASADLWCCSVLTNTWTKAKAFVEGRSGHSSVLFGNSMYIFGGKKKKTFFNDVCVYNFTTGDWKSISISGAPSPRQDHSASVIGDKMLIYGGRRGNDVFCDVYAFDMVELTWSELDLDWALPRMYGHRALSLGPLLVFLGGLDGHNDVDLTYVVDIETWKVRTFKYAGNRPLRLASCGVVYDGQKLIVMFGLSIFYVEFPQVLKSELSTRTLVGSSNLSAICRRRSLASSSRNDFNLSPRMEIKKDHRCSVGPLAACGPPALETPEPKVLGSPREAHVEAPVQKTEVKAIPIQSTQEKEKTVPEQTTQEVSPRPSGVVKIAIEGVLNMAKATTQASSPPKPTHHESPPPKPTTPTKPPETPTQSTTTAPPKPTHHEAPPVKPTAATKPPAVTTQSTAPAPAKAVTNTTAPAKPTLPAPATPTVPAQPKQATTTGACPAKPATTAPARPTTPSGTTAVKPAVQTAPATAKPATTANGTTPAKTTAPTTGATPVAGVVRRATVPPANHPDLTPKPANAQATTSKAPDSARGAKPQATTGHQQQPTLTHSNSGQTQAPRSKPQAAAATKPQTQVQAKPAAPAAKPSSGAPSGTQTPRATTPVSQGAPATQQKPSATQPAKVAPSQQGKTVQVAKNAPQTAAHHNEQTGSPLTRPATSAQLLKPGPSQGKAPSAGGQAQHPMKSTSNTKFDKGVAASKPVQRPETAKAAPAQAKAQKGLGFDYFARITKGPIEKLTKISGQQTYEEVMNKIRDLFRGIQCRTIDVLIDGEREPLTSESLQRALVEWRETRANAVNIIVE